MLNDELLLILQFIVQRSELMSYRGIIMLKKRLLLSLAALAALVLTAADATVNAQRPELTEEFHQSYTSAFRTSTVR
jgi:hypothetical protein